MPDLNFICKVAPLHTWSHDGAFLEHVLLTAETCPSEDTAAQAPWTIASAKPRRSVSKPVGEMLRLHSIMIKVANIIYHIRWNIRYMILKGLNSYNYKVHVLIVDTQHNHYDVLVPRNIAIIFNYVISVV